MTSEVCIMNRLAVVLAADSATTVTEWTERGSENRYFKGANKIFQLSDHHPIGLMIFDSADIMRVPWETVVKSFRSVLQKKSFNTLDEYAQEFFSFLENDARLFPPEVQKAIFLESARSAALHTTIRPPDPNVTPDQRKAENNDLVNKRRTVLGTMPFAPGLTDAAYADVVARWREDLVKMFREWGGTFEWEYPEDLNAFSDLGMLEIFKDPGVTFGKTGLVFAGFGDHDVFPAFVSYRSCGVVVGKHIGYSETKEAITHEFPAWFDVVPVV